MSDLEEFLNSKEYYCPRTNLTKHINRVQEAKSMVPGGFVRCHILLAEVEDFLKKIEEIVNVHT